MDWRRRESEGKAKIEGYMSISDEEAHQRSLGEAIGAMLSTRNVNEGKVE